MIAIAIDGPSGAGKSTLSRILAKRLGYIYADTGALYRAIGLYALRREKNTKNAAEITALLPEISVTLVFIEGEQRVLLNGEDVSGLIRTPEVSMAASAVSAHKSVREFLFSLQRDLAKANNIVMDGRDIGTVVLPDAQVKIFLTATPEDRANRRFLELKDRGEDVRFEDVLADVIERDRNDSSRAEAPLKAAADAVILDTTGNEFEESLELLTNTVRERLA